MRRFALLVVALSLVVLTVDRGPLSADTCTCPWQVRQLTTTGGDCALATQNARQNAGSWAYFACSAQAQNNNVCTYVWTDLGCTVDEYGTATSTSLINFKCTICY